jgi:hypothetical protein
MSGKVSGHPFPNGFKENFCEPSPFSSKEIEHQAHAALLSFNVRQNSTNRI